MKGSVGQASTCPEGNAKLCRQGKDLGSVSFSMGGSCRHPISMTRTSLPPLPACNGGSTKLTFHPSQTQPPSSTAPSNTRAMAGSTTQGTPQTIMCSATWTSQGEHSVVSVATDAALGGLGLVDLWTCVFDAMSGLRWCICPANLTCLIRHICHSCQFAPRQEDKPQNLRLMCHLTIVLP